MSGQEEEEEEEEEQHRQVQLLQLAAVTPRGGRVVTLVLERCVAEPSVRCTVYVAGPVFLLF